MANCNRGNVRIVATSPLGQNLLYAGRPDERFGGIVVRIDGASRLVAHFQCVWRSPHRPLLPSTGEVDIRAVPNRKPICETLHYQRPESRHRERCGPCASQPAGAAPGLGALHRRTPAFDSPFIHGVYTGRSEVFGVRPKVRERPIQGLMAITPFIGPIVQPH